MADGDDRSQECATKKKESVDEKELERLAIESILLDAKRGKLRAESFGPSGWQKCHIPRTNKRFLNSLVTEVVSTNKRMKIQKLQREKPKAGCQTDVGGTASGRDKSQKLKPAPTREDSITSGRGICEQKRSGQANSSVRSSDRDEVRD